MSRVKICFQLRSNQMLQFSMDIWRTVFLTSTHDCHLCDNFHVITYLSIVIVVGIKVWQFSTCLI